MATDTNSDHDGGLDVLVIMVGVWLILVALVTLSMALALWIGGTVGAVTVSGLWLGVGSALVGTGWIRRCR